MAIASDGGGSCLRKSSRVLLLDIQIILMTNFMQGPTLNIDSYYFQHSFAAILTALFFHLYYPPNSANEFFHKVIQFLLQYNPLSVLISTVKHILSV